MPARQMLELGPGLSSTTSSPPCSRLGRCLETYRRCESCPKVGLSRTILKDRRKKPIQAERWRYKDS